MELNSAHRIISRFTLMFAIIVAATLCADSNADVTAGPIVNPSNGHSYYLLTAGTWDDAELEAVGMGGHLMTVDDAVENDWVYSTFANYGGSPRGLWIGLNDKDQEGDFKWVDGGGSAYRNWASGEPNGSVTSAEDDVVHMWYPGHEYAGQWNDHSTNATEAFGVPICGVVEMPGPTLSIRVSEVSIEWFAEIDNNYQVQYIDSVNTTWQDLGNPIVGTGADLTFRDPIAAEQKRRLYRVIIVSQ